MTMSNYTHPAPETVIPSPPRRARDLLFTPPANQGLNGAWIEIFRAGDYGDRGAWSPEDLDRLAASYNPRLQAAPVVLGHPADDAPAYGWVRGLRRAGASLWAQLEKVDPAFEALLRAGRFRQRSVALYAHYPPTGGPYLRHLGFLGAAPPAVKALAPVRFFQSNSVSFAFDNDEQFTPASLSAAASPEALMSEPKSTLDNFLSHLRAFFNADSSHASVIPSPAPCGLGAEGAEASPPGKARGEGPAFSERLAALEQRLDSLTAEKQSAATTVSEAEQSRRREQVTFFVESLRRRGRFPPVFDHWGVPEFLERLAAADTALPAFSETCPAGMNSAEPGGTCRQDDQASPSTLLAWFEDFLSRLPAVIDFRELSTPHPHAARGSKLDARLVHFTEPQRGMTVDPASVELAERAESLAAELGITYADALTQLREEHRHTPTTA